MIKKLSEFCFIFLLSSCISSVSLLAQDQKKETREIKRQNVESNHKKESINKIDLKNEEDIPSPDEYEDWVEPDDEQIYKFEINQVTPIEGLKGGFLIYYGHLIKPPYKIEIRDEKDWSVYINNIPFDLPSKEFNEKYSKRRKARINQSQLTIEEKRSSEEWNALFKEIKRRMLEIRIEYGDQKKADEECKKYLANHPKIIDFRYRTYKSFDIKPRIKGYDDSFIIIAGSNQPPRSNEEVLKDHIEKLNNDKKEYEYKIVNNSIYFTSGGYYSYLSKMKLNELCKIRSTAFPTKIKLIHLYKSFNVFHLSAVKLLYYNFNCDTFYEAIKNNEI